MGGPVPAGGRETRGHLAEGGGHGLGGVCPPTRLRNSSPRIQFRSRSGQAGIWDGNVQTPGPRQLSATRAARHTSRGWTQASQPCCGPVFTGLEDADNTWLSEKASKT